MYLRQVDISLINTKFIESHRHVLAGLLDLVIPANCIDTTESGINRFAARYGFLEKPIRIRFRIHAPEIRALTGISCPDITGMPIAFVQPSSQAIHQISKG